MKTKYKEGAKLVGKPDENTFEQLLEQNEIQITTNALRDHHALGVLDRFARTLKNALTQSMLREKTADWVKFVKEIEDNYNNTPHSAINDITPNDAFKKENEAIIHALNIGKTGSE